MSVISLNILININSMEKILIVGGGGFIGTHTAKMLCALGYEPILFDRSFENFSCNNIGSLVLGDLSEPDDIDQVFQNHRFRVVLHLAAEIDPGESVTDPEKYYRANVVNTIQLLETMKRFGVKKLIFSSSAAIFGRPQQAKINEQHHCLPISPYGSSKLMIERILQDYSQAYDFRSICLRYFNAAGADPDGKIQILRPRKTNIIPILLQNLSKPDKSITIFGNHHPTPDGTCIRDYVHVNDIARAHIQAMERLLDNGHSDQFNLGNGQGYSVLDVIEAVETVTGQKIHRIYGPPRSCDPPILVADASKALKELGWEPKIPNLEEMISHAYQSLTPDFQEIFI